MTALKIIKTLLHKNYLIFKAHRSKYILIYISPLLILLLLIALQAWTQKNFTWETLDPPEISLAKIPKCYGESCLTLGYIVEGRREDYIDHVLNYVKRQNSFDDKDIKQMPLRAHQAMDYLRQHPNKTQFIVVFCTNSSWKIGEIEVPCYGQDYHLNFYTIIYNLSLYHRVPYMGNLKQSYPKDFVTIKLKKDIDEAIIKYYSPQTKINITFSEFPSKTSRFVEGISIISQYGSFFIMIPYLIILVLEGSKLLLQKQKRLRIGLNIVGVSHFQFYFSEIATYFIHVLIISFTFCISGYILDVKFWSKGLIFFDFYILVTNGLIIGLIAFCVTALVSQKSLGMSIIYGFVLYSIVMQWLFTGGFILELLYMTSAGPVVKFMKYLFNIYPSFHFSKLFSDISRKADNHIDTYQNRYVEGTEFKFEDLFKQASQSYQKPFPHSYVLPSPFESAVYLTLTSFIFIITLILLDKLVESNRGFRDRLCKWIYRKRKNSFYNLQSNEEEENLVKITNLQKIYDNKIYALTGVSLDLKKGEIVSLLGENGAGKSTLINILIGALAKSKGEAIIDNKNIDENIEEIRKIIGVCPQFDILWEELTAGQHIEMFHRLKNIEVDNMKIIESLESVNLQKNKDGKVCTFSGGMRRRLSLAISMIGNPKLLILDEPTTGMDAKIRLLTWKLILNLRKHKTVLITTHNMEEAECVSDRIMIMSKGRITASGSVVQLKKKYGQGYVVKGFDPQKGEDVEIKCQESELQKILQQIEERQIQNWSLHETTLEEVFLNVSNRF